MVGEGEKDGKTKAFIRKLFVTGVGTDKIVLSLGDKSRSLGGAGSKCDPSKYSYFDSYAHGFI